MTVESMEAANLIAGIRAGDPQAFRRLYDTYADRVMGFVLRLTGSRTETEDIVQEVFVAAYASRASFQGRSQLLTWLLGIASRRWRDRCRQRTPQTTTLFAEEVAEGTASHDAAVLFSPRSLETDVINALTLADALARLEPLFREALLLVASQGLTYREAAEIMDEPIGTVKWRVAQATRRMSRLLDAVEEECNAMQQSSSADICSCRQ